MNKKTRNVAIVLSIILLIGILAYFGKLPLSISGSSTLSLNSVQLQSNNPYLNGQAWLLTFSAGGLGQSYYGTITPSDVDGFTTDSTRTTKNLNIQVTYDDQSCNYPIMSTGSFTPIYDISQYTYTYIPLISECDLATGAKKSGIPSSNIILWKKPSGSLTCHIVYQTGTSPIGSMGNGNVNAPYTITLNVDGNIATKKIDPTSGSTQGAIGDYAYGIWNGNLVSGISCPASYNYKASYVNGIWRIIDNQAYTNYVNKFNTRLSTSYFTADSDVNTWVSDLQYYAAYAKLSKSFGTIDTSSSLTNAVVEIPLSSPIQMPVTSLYVKSSTLGIYTPVPNIQIVSSSSSCFKTGESGVLSVNIKNSGDQGGTYRVYAQCQNPFSQTQSASGSLNAGESRTVNLALSATATQKTQSTCTVSVETTGGTKTATANVCVDPQITCTIPYPNKFCGFSGSQEAVFQCSENGATKNLVNLCAINEYCDVGVCKQTQSTGKSNLDLLDKIKGLFSGALDFLTYVKYFAIFIISLLSIFQSYDLLRKIETLRRNNKLRGLVAFVIGVGLGYALFLFIGSFIFWILIIIGIVYLIAGSVIKSYIPFLK